MLSPLYTETPHECLYSDQLPFKLDNAIYKKKYSAAIASCSHVFLIYFFSPTLTAFPFVGYQTVAVQFQSAFIIITVTLITKARVLQIHEGL